MDHLFSSPEKPKEIPARRVNGNRKSADKTISSEADMDVDDSMFIHGSILRQN